jgi:predicted ATP-binding protein involved in virulence
MKQKIRLASLELANFRGFDKLNITFDDNLTVLIGNNGSGKTTILDALAGCLQYMKEQVQDRSQTEVFKNADIRVANDVDTFDILTKFTEPSLTILKAQFVRNGTTSINFTKKEKKDEGWQEIEIDAPDGEMEYIIKDWKKANESIEILAYYPCESISVENGTASKFNPFKLEEAYDDVLNGRFNFGILKDWLIYQYNIKQEVGENAFFDRIAALVTGENGILNDEDSTQNFTQLRITYLKPEEPKGSLSFVKNDAAISELQLSSGEKMLFALVADIARRLIIANPKSKDPLKEGSGVVLIDEIDLHLHPRWQRKVIGKLQAIFPNVQFVVTTHSALVLENVEAEQIFILKKENGHTAISQPSFSKGHSLEYIMSEIMETNPHSQVIDDYLVLLRQGLISTKKGKALKKIIDNMDANSAEKVRLSFALKRYEKQPA